MGRRGAAPTLDGPTFGLTVRSDQDAGLRTLATATGLTRAELIREAIDLLIQKYSERKAA